MGIVWFLLGLYVIVNLVAVVKAFSVDSKIYRLQRDVESLKELIASLSTGGERPRETRDPAPRQPVPAESPPAASSRPVITAPPAETKTIGAPTASVESMEPTVTGDSFTKTAHEAPAPAPQRSLEMILGTKWLNWVGMIMLLFGMGYFMKYAYDNAWVGPKGRLFIGVLGSFAALALGEKFRKRDWVLLFRVFTGGALAGLYLCVYFSFQVYHLSGQGVASLLAVLITAFAVGLAVLYDAIAIEILALVGGFLSPVLLSTGENHPYALFTYIAVLDLVAIATAAYRRWPLVDLLCLAGTAIMYLGWAMKFYTPDQMQPALIYTSLFYLMFLLIPTIHGVVNRLAHDVQGMMMILAACALSFASYFSILFPAYRHTLGFVTIAQALIVFLLFYLWVRRVGGSGTTGVGLLSIALGLVTIAIPIQLKVYGIPITWAMEGVVLTYVGIRLKHHIPRIAGLVALGLSVLGLLIRLPLHAEPFTPIINTPFGSWAFVIAAIWTAAHLRRTHEKGAQKEKEGNSRAGVAMILGLTALALSTFILNTELLQLWQYDYGGPNLRLYRSVSLLILWIALSLAMTLTATTKVQQGWNKDWMIVSVIYYSVTLIVFLLSLFEIFAGAGQDRPFVNIGFTSGLVFILSFAYGSRQWRRVWHPLAADAMETVANGVLALLLALELRRWGSVSLLLTPRMSINLISVAWALQAFTLILVGLAKNRPLLRYLGFVLFGVTVGKIVIVDMSQLEKVYRIVSFIGCGLLLVAAGYFYQRYSSKIMERLEQEKQV